MACRQPPNPSAGISSTRHSSGSPPTSRNDREGTTGAADVHQPRNVLQSELERFCLALWGTADRKRGPLIRIGLRETG